MVCRIVGSITVCEGNKKTGVGFSSIYVCKGSGLTVFRLEAHCGMTRLSLESMVIPPYTSERIDIELGLGSGEWFSIRTRTRRR